MNVPTTLEGLRMVIGQSLALFAEMPAPLQSGFTACGVALAMVAVARMRPRRALPRAELTIAKQSRVKETVPLPPSGSAADRELRAGRPMAAETIARQALIRSEAKADPVGAGEALLTMSDTAAGRLDAGDSLTLALEAERCFIKARASEMYIIAAHARQARALTLTGQSEKGRKDLESLRERLMLIGETSAADEVDDWIFAASQLDDRVRAT